MLTDVLILPSNVNYIFLHRKQTYEQEIVVLVFCVGTAEVSLSFKTHDVVGYSEIFLTVLCAFPY